MQRAGARSVDVVGYSAGGVVARLWVRDHGGDSLARRVVTIGSPHHGTDLAGLGGDVAPDTCPEACHQLQPDSELLRKLNAGDETPAGPLWVSIWTTDDQVVVPPSSADLEGALDFTVQSVCPRAVVSHARPAPRPRRDRRRHPRARRRGARRTRPGDLLTAASAGRGRRVAPSRTR